MKLPREPALGASWQADLRKTLDLGEVSVPRLRHTAPNLSYGRHHGPPYPHARSAAVLILLYRHESRWNLPLMIRAEMQGVHAGEVALPGGRRQPGETPVETALREFWEETGFQVSAEAIVGELAPTYVYASNHWVRTFVALEPSQPIWSPDPTEVQTLLQVPLAELFEAENYGLHQVVRRQVRFTAPYFRAGKRYVWGATFRMLYELAEALSSPSQNR